ncbi:YceI family protein [Mucilaginibacter sp. BT774]|uniref:YceI family protein n=1 Tax=Mucilaginibacter sp. BT774 TaxID=3062276 RepID=UPI002674544C|nr:YceI family protein [Mucilaginibacter sp. BT774]MDO3628200.1 YceI family protein [Mucilaginibacter sp. BT774]
MNKTILLLLVPLFTASIAKAQYIPVDKESTLSFKIGNFGFDVNGSFTGFKGLIYFDPKNVTASSFDVTIDASTVNTDNSLRDEHLRDASYFDVKNYPAIHYISSKITSSGNSFVAYGKLTIKGRSKDISIPFTAIQGTDEYLFKGTFKINRRDFGVGGTSTISNELQVSLNVLAKKQTAI